MCVLLRSWPCSDPAPIRNQTVRVFGEVLGSVEGYCVSSVLNLVI